MGDIMFSYGEKNKSHLAFFFSVSRLLSKPLGDRDAFVR